MRTFEVIAGLVVGAVILIVLKAIGLILKFAIIAGLLGMVAGFVLARAFRRNP